MPSPRLPAFAAALLLLTACSASATPAPASNAPAPASTAPASASNAPASNAPASTAPAPSTAPTPGATPPKPTEVPKPTPAANVHAVIRAETTQALSPQYTFASAPVLVVTDDGRAITMGATPAIYPPALLPGLLEQKISAGGVAKLLTAARAAGLLGTTTDFTSGAPLAGGVMAHLTITDGGTTWELTGSVGAAGACTAATTGCAMPKAGTPDAFAWFWNGLQDLATWMGADLGSAAAPYPGTGYRILVGPPPTDTMPGLAVLTWPLKDKPLSSFGTAFSLAGFHCGVVTGDDALRLRPLFEQAKTISAWVDDPTQSATRSVIARQVLPGDPDPCTGS